MKGVVSSGSLDTSKAGQFAFQQGGNAIDALIASQLAAGVCEPLLTGLGGSGLAMVKFEGQVYNVDLFTVMPGIQQQISNKPIISKNLKIQNIDLNFGTASQRFVIGEGTIAVPSVPQGLAMLHKRFGTISLDVLAKPALSLAKDGFTVSGSCSYLIKLLTSIIQQSETMKRWFMPGGRHLQEGEKCHTPEVYNDIQHFIKTKSRFYTQGIYSDSIKTLHNSIISNIDIGKYNTKITRSVATKYRFGKLHSPIFPSIGGDILRNGLGKGETNNSLSVVRNLSESYIESMNSLPNVVQNSLGNTTHISTMDDSGNCAAMTTSLGETAGLVLPNTGVVLNNFLGEADVAHPKLMKHPGHRLLTMCTPTILELKDATWVLGSGGSNRIPGILMQIIRKLNQGCTLEEAIVSPRFHTNLDINGQLKEVLAEHLSQSDEAILRSEFPTIDIKIFNELNLYFGGVHMVGMKRGELKGFGDPRRNGYCLYSH